MILHSYLTKGTVTAIDGSKIVLDDALKTKSGQMTSEGLHMKTTEEMVTKNDFRNKEIMMHDKAQRELRKDIMYKNGAKKAFRNETIWHQN